MLQEVADAIEKKASEPQCAITGVAVYKCPRVTCSGFAFPPLMQCTLCRNIIEPNSSIAPPSKLAKLSVSQIRSPILILSVGKSGIFDARHTPCVITTSHLSCNVKVEGSWCSVNVRPSEVQAMVFCEELQVVFLKPRDSLKHSLVATLKVDSSRIDDQNFMKWIILVLGQQMTNSPSENVSVPQMELFASSIRENDGYCKMDCTLLEARKLLLECGLRLPRAEARLQSTACSNVAPSTASQGQTDASTPLHSTMGGLQTQVNISQPQSHSDGPCRTEGGLLTNVLNTLSSTGVQLLDQSSCHSNENLNNAQPNQNSVEDDNDDLIILSEESTDCSRVCSQSVLTSVAVPKPTPTTTPQIQSFKFDYKPPGSTDSVTLTQADLDCLAPGGLLNDAIINFYLKYLYFEQLTEVQRQATYLFNCFFYSRLAGVSATPTITNCRPPTTNQPSTNVLATQNNASGVVGSTAESSKTRHANVAKWTRRVDLFCKDYIIIPINEASHWFLGLVCYPWMAGMVSYTALYRAAAFDLCQLTNEFLDVDLIKFSNDVDDKTISQEPIERRPDDPKGVAFDRWRRRRLAWLRSRGINAMPCILLFDSLPCQTRVSNLHVIRDYLQSEWDSRRAEQDGLLHFDKDTIRGFSPRVPSQSNLVDCGIYLLHYVEMFFKQPVQSYTKDYFQNEMSSWFSEDTVGQKRTQIQALLTHLNEQYHAEEQIH